MRQPLNTLLTIVSPFNQRCQQSLHGYPGQSPGGE